MKSFLSLLVLLILPFLLFAQESRRVSVAGTHCTIIPPLHFLPAEGFAGFSSEEADAAISVIDVETSAKLMTDLFEPKSEGKKYMKIKRTDTLTVEGKKTFIRVYTKKTGDKNLEVQVYILGNTKNAILVTANYGAEKEGLASIMREALLTARFDESLTASPEAAAPFSVDGKRWGFKSSLFVGNTLTYESTDIWIGSKGNFEVSSFKKRFTPEEKEAFLQTQIQGMSNLQITLTSMRPVTIHYLEGFELWGQGTTNTNETATMHYTVLFQDDAGKVYTMMGTANARPKYWEKRFRALAESFKLK